MFWLAHIFSGLTLLRINLKTITSAPKGNSLESIKHNKAFNLTNTAWLLSLRSKI